MFQCRLHHSTFVVCFVFMAAAAVTRADAQGLSDAETASLNTLLGPGVLGPAVAASPITDPTRLLPLRSGTWTFQVTGGPNQGMTETDTITASSQPAAGAQWQGAVGQSAVYSLGTVANGNLVSPSEQDLNQGVLTRYSPPRPILFAGMQPSLSQNLPVQVNVFDLGAPNTVTHTGSLTCTITYVGRYQITVPAGTYDADLIRWQFEGQVGPASVSDVEYRFFADGVGPVAVIDRQSVQAFLVYNNDTKYGKVLISAPQ